MFFAVARHYGAKVYALNVVVPAAYAAANVRLEPTCGVLAVIAETTTRAPNPDVAVSAAASLPVRAARPMRRPNGALPASVAVPADSRAAFSRRAR